MNSSRLTAAVRRDRSRSPLLSLRTNLKAQKAPQFMSVEKTFGHLGWAPGASLEEGKSVLFKIKVFLSKNRRVRASKMKRA